MQNSIRWRSNRLDGAVVGVFFGNPWSNESDANVEDSDCRVRMLLFFSIVTKSRQDFCLTGLTYGGIAGVFMNTIVVGCLL